MLRLISTSRSTSQSSLNVNWAFPFDWYRLCFGRPIMHSNWRTTQILNLQLTWFKYWQNFLSLITFFNHFAPALKALALSEYIVFCLPRLAVIPSKLLINSNVARLGTNSKYTALLTPHENKSMCALDSPLDVILQWLGPE